MNNYVLKRRLHTKKAILIQLLESQIFPFTAAAVRMTICKRPASHFDNHKKYIFETLLNEIKRVLHIKEYFNECVLVVLILASVT